MLVQDRQVQRRLHLIVHFADDQGILTDIVLHLFNVIIDDRLEKFEDLLVCIVTIVYDIIVEFVI